MLIVRSNFVNSHQKGEIFSCVHVAYICKWPASRQFHEPNQTIKSARMSVQCQAACLKARRRDATLKNTSGRVLTFYHTTTA